MRSNDLPLQHHTVSSPERCASLVAAVQRILPEDDLATRTERLAEAKLLFARLAQHLFEGVALFDREGKLLYLNSSLARALGVGRVEAPVDAVQRFFADIVERASRAKSTDATRYASVRYEAQVAGAHGRRMVAIVSAHRVDSRGEPAGYFALVSDITARVDCEAELRQAKSELRLLSSQLHAAEDLERKRVASELHDGIGQSLGGLKFGLENCAALLARGDIAAASAHVRQLVQAIRGAIEELRRISMNLRPSMLDDLGALATVSGLVRELRATHRGLRLETLVELRDADIPPQARVAIYRIAQEALANVVSHARARNAWLTLQRNGDSIVLGVRDDGAGFDPLRYSAVDADGRGLGLASMRERAEASGGRCVVESKPGHGTQVMVYWRCAPHDGG